LLVHEVHAAPKQIAGGAHGLGVGVGQGQHSGAQQAGDLLGVKFVVLGLTAVDCLHIEGVAEHEGEGVLGTQIGDPVPSEDAFDADHDVFSIGTNSFQQMLGVGGKVAVQEHSARRVEDAQVHASCVKIDAAIELVLPSVEVQLWPPPKIV